MGYLNNVVITVDAILTDRGRELLARGDGSFKITQFALSDDEIDYSLYDPTDPSGSAFFGKKIENMPYEMTSSMHEDHKRSKKLELQWLSGFVVDKSKDAGVNCKIHKTIVEMIKN